MIFITKIVFLNELPPDYNKKGPLARPLVPNRRCRLA